MEQEKRELIELIEWYRDEWHKTDFCHSALIQQAEKATTVSQLNDIWLIVDGWLE